MLCYESSTNMSIDYQYYNRYVHLRRPIFPTNHNSASLYNPEHILDFACVCYSQEAPFTKSAAWVLDHHFSIDWCSYCSANPLRLQSLYLLPVPPACWHKFNSNWFNDHERVFFLASAPSLGHQYTAISSCWLLWLPVIAQWYKHSMCSRKYVARKYHYNSFPHLDVIQPYHWNIQGLSWNFNKSIIIADIVT